MPNTSPSTTRAFAIANLTRRPLVLTLNSKESLHLAPGEAVSGIAEQEVTNNPDIKKLLALSLIQCRTIDGSERERSDKKVKATTHK